MDGIGLVFAGGGGKGAYQIGVWKFLREWGLDQYVQAVSGTSVGALNGALFSAGDFDCAERLWKNIQPDQILSPKGISLDDIAKWIARVGFLAAAPAIGSTISAVTASSLASGLGAMLGRSYAFSRDGLLELMERELDFTQIRNSSVLCFATCLAFPELSLRRFRLQDYLPEEQIAILLATSAIPLVFDSVTFQGERYYDGGVPLVGDNVPVQPLYEMGLEHIIVVHLSREQPLDRSRYPKATLIEIVPQVELGGPVDGTLDFTASGAAWRIEQGYRDAEKIFGAYIKMAAERRKNEILWQAFLDCEAEHQRQLAQLRQEQAELEREREALLRERETDGFDEMCDELGMSS